MCGSFYSTNTYVNRKYKIVYCNLKPQTLFNEQKENILLILLINNSDYPLRITAQRCKTRVVSFHVIIISMNTYLLLYWT